MNKKIINCKACGKEVAKGAKKCPSCGKDNRNFFAKHKIITGILVIVIIVALGSSGEDSTNSGTKANEQQVLSDSQIETNEQQVLSDSELETNEVEVENTTSVEENIPTEYKSALKKAKSYSDVMNMSKAGLYDQLTSEYGEKFSQEAAQYAIDNVEADWKENALKKAQSYQEQMSMSPSAIYDQLISEYGEKFTEEEAQYAIDNLE